MKLEKCIVVPLLAVILTACAPSPTEMQATDGSAPASLGKFANSGTPVESMLAYEHQLHILLPAKLIPERLAALHAACVNTTFGACNVLEETQSGTNHATVQMRIDPAGVDPIVALARQGGEISSRVSRAEDLSVAVMDNRKKQEQLTDYLVRLDKLANSPNVTVSELIEAAKEQAKSQKELELLSQEAAQQQRRIATNLLTIQISDDSTMSFWERLGESISRFFKNLAEGVDYAFSILAYGLPTLLLSFPLLLLWRKAWRRFTGRDKKAQQVQQACNNPTEPHQD